MSKALEAPGDKVEGEVGMVEWRRGVSGLFSSAWAVGIATIFCLGGPGIFHPIVSVCVSCGSVTRGRTGEGERLKVWDGR